MSVDLLIGFALGVALWMPALAWVKSQATAERKRLEQGLHWIAYAHGADAAAQRHKARTTLYPLSASRRAWPAA